MLIHNRFTKDSDADRTERLECISGHIDEYSMELGLSDDKIEWAQNAHDRWYDILIGSDAERAETGGAYISLRLEEKDAAKFYCKAKALLKAILSSHGNSEVLLEEYGLRGKSPRGYKKLIASIDVLKGTHDRLVSEGDVRVLPGSIVDKLVEHRVNMDALWHEAIDDKAEARDARRERQEIFDRDTKMLQYLFALCKLHWGNQDTKLMNLGFVQKSAIWTFKKKD